VAARVDLGVEVGPIREICDSDKALMPGAGSGEVYLQTATAIFRVELATGRITRTPTPKLEQFSSFVAGPGWVVSKTIDNDSGVVVRTGHRATPLPAGLRPNGRLHPAPGGDLWLTPEEPLHRTRIVRRLDVDGRPAPGGTIRLPDEPGTLSSDGARYLVVTNPSGVYQYRPSGPRRLTTGALIAVGAHHLLVWDCDDQARCNPYRVARTGGARTRLGVDHQPLLGLYQHDPAQAAAFGGDLSPDGTHAALRVPGTQPGSEPLAVLDLATGTTNTVPGSLTDTNPNAQYAWTANSRWLLAITDHQLRGYDTTTHTSRTITITDQPLLHLTTSTATGN